MWYSTSTSTSSRPAAKSKVRRHSRSARRKIAWQGVEYETLDFEPCEKACTFDVADVTIGVNFHWERRETQKFTGAMRIIVEGDKITLVNRLPLEDYLMSVISSEMSATANEEFLKAHAVISRSWLIAQIINRKKSRRQIHALSPTMKLCAGTTEKTMPTSMCVPTTIAKDTKASQGRRPQR